MRPEHWLFTIPLRLRSLFRRREVDQELDDELRDHIERKTEEYVATGLPLKEAHRRARLDLGGIEQTKEKCRDARRVNWIQDLSQDLRYGLRILRKSPGFTAVAVLTLALGIGINTALFTIVNSVVLNPLPYPQPSRLVSIYQRTAQFQTAGDTYPNFLDWEKENRSFDALAAYSEHDFNLTGVGEPEKLRGQMVSAGFFSMLGVKPLLGRTFRPEEDQLGASPVVLLADGLWKRRFASSPHILGQSLTMYGKAYTIVGVVPGRAPFYKPSDVFVPIGTWDDPGFHDRRMSMGMSVIGRLKPSVKLRQAQADMNAIARNLEAAYPEVDKGVGIALIPLKETIVGDIRPILLLLLGAVGFVLLIASANIGGLLLARSTARAREFAVRAALGANRTRVIRQLLTESFLVATLGGGLGLLLAAGSTKAILNALPQALPRGDEIQLDTHVLVFTLVASALTAFLFGLIPALKTSRTDLHETFKEGGRGLSASRHRAHGTFVVIEMAIALVLLAGAGLMLRSLAGLWNVNPGFDPHHILFFNVAPSPARLASRPSQIRDAFRELPKRFEAVPGIEAASPLFGSLPMQGDSEVPVWLDGQAPPMSTADAQMNFAMIYGVTAAYWKILRIPLLRGRYLEESDDENSRPVVVIDENLAHKFFPREDPIGKRLHIGLIGTAPEIVGIVGHVKHEGLGSGGRERIPAQFYMPFTQIPEKWMPEVSLGVDFVVRTAGPPESFIGAIREASRQFDSQQVVYAFDTMEAIVSSSIWTQHFSMMLLSAFAALALLLSCMGIYGLISYLVAQRTHEIGVRVALGAFRGDVLWLILSHGIKMTIIGIAIGLAGAFGLTRLLSSLLFGVSATDPLTFGGAAILLILIGLLACYMPARRAMRVDPMVALRHE